MDVEETIAEFRKKNHDEAVKWIDRIENLLGDESFFFAEQTLVGILETIERADKVTQKQKDAIINIETSVYERR